MSDGVVGALRVVLGLDTAEFDKNLARTKKSVSSFSVGRGALEGFKQAEGSIRGLAGQAGLLGSAMGGMGLAGAAAAAALVGAFVQVRAALSFGDEIGDTANKLAVTTDALQEYRYAVHQLGGQYTDADAALEGFSKAFGAAHAQLTKKATKPFEALGLDASSFDNTEDALQAVIKKISELKSTAEQAAIADKLGLTAMLPAIRAGVGEMDRLRQAAHDVGFVMDADLIAKAGEANDKFEDLQQIIGVQLHSAFVDLAPLVLEITQAFADAAKALRGWTMNPKTMAELRLAAGYAAALGKGGMLGGLKWLKENQADITQTLKTPDNIDWSKFESPNRTFKVGSDRAGTSLAHVGAGDKSAQIKEANDAAISEASKAELSARIALTANIEQVAALKADQVKQETADANQRLQDQVNAGKITQAAADTAIALNNRAQTEKLALVERQKLADLDAQEFDQRHEIVSVYDRIAGINAAIAGTAEERNRIEAKNLADNQRLDMLELKSKLDRQVESGEITDSYRKERLAAQKDLDAAETLRQSREAQARVVAERLAADMAELDRQTRLAQVQADLERTVIGRRNAQLKLLQLELEQYRRQKQAVIDDPNSTPQEVEDARRDKEQADQEYEARKKVIERENGVAEVFREAEANVGDMADAFKRHDWVRLLQDLRVTIESLGKAFGPGGTLGDKIASIGGIASAVGQVVGGKAGRAISSAGSAATTAMMLTGNPVIAGLAAVTAGLAELLKGKPSNHAAITTLTDTGYALHSSGKETSETVNAVKQTSQAILDGEAALKAAGISLTKTVTGLDLGTRDLTHIYLSTGEELRSAVGDPAAAAETALKAVLEGATYTDEVQKKLVESMLAAGKGFDDISAALAGYAQAQAVGGQISDAILQLTDPKAYARKQVTDDIQAQRDSLQAAAAAGYYTADQLAGLNAQLDRLEQLQLDDVMKQFGDAATNAADQWKAAAQSLTDWLASLTGQTATPEKSAESAYAALQAAGLAARGGDVDAAGQVVALGNAYIEAAKAVAGSEQEFRLAVARARAIGSSVQRFAQSRIGAAGDGALALGGSEAVDSTVASIAASTSDGAVNASAADSAQSELSALRAEVAALRVDQRIAAETLARNTGAAADVLDRWEGGGLPPTRVA